VFLAVLLGLAAGRARAEGKAEQFPKPPVAKADEPLAGTLSLAKSAEFLDNASMAWAREKKCAACHTGYAYLMARPLLGDPKAPALVQTRKFFEDRVANWDRGGKGAGLPEGTEGVTEVVATASALAYHDGQSTGKLHPR